MPDTPQRLPSYLSEATFRVYEPHIRTAVNNWPEETEFPREIQHDGKGTVLSPHTFVARFRDALTSLRRFHWETDVDTVKLKSMAGDFCVTLNHETSSVWFRNKTKPGRPAEFLEDARRIHPEKSSKTVREVWLKWSEAEVKAVCLLITTEKLVGPFVLEGKVDEKLVSELEVNLNVSFTYDEGTNRTIIT